jgi:hypothetical protein
MVFIYDTDALDRLTDVEGEAWRKLQDRNQDSPYCFHAWKRAWDYRQRMMIEDPSYAEEPVATFLEESGDGAIYGNGGWDRYVVRLTGELVLLSGSASSRNKTKAEQAGFTVS